MTSTMTRFGLQILILFLGFVVICSGDLESKRINHRLLPIEDHRLSILTKLEDVSSFNKILDNILIPRVVGTPGHDKVRDYIVSFMRDLRWYIEVDAFQDQTPNFGIKTFENIIVTLNPDAERFLVLACHYDSKYFANQEFLGATDSAVPCAMQLHLAYVLQNYLNTNRQNNDFSLKMIFFDGEEAFKEWGPTDSIYGARHLAAKWEQEDRLKQIDMMILLDLLGSPDPQFYSFFSNTENWYKAMVLSEERLASLGYLERYSYSSVSVHQSSNRYFQPRSTHSMVEDDHIPFLQRNVPILHMIPIPFPEVWHKISDDRSAVDLATVENLSRIIRLFVLEYLHIPV